MSGPLAGVRVIDFGQYVAGPLAAMLLADQGADVIRVDPPGGPRMKSAANATWNRGKRSIVLDLQRDDDRATARRLIGSADVVIENFRPGVMERLGLGAAAMTAADPRLVYCSLPGFAADDPRAGVAAWEGVVGAATDTYRTPAAGSGDRPVYTAIPIASNFAAFIAATAAVVALLARERDGLGQRVEAPLYDSMFTAMGFRAVRMPGNGTVGPTTGGPGGVYRCSDGRWVHFAPLNPRHMQWFVDALELQSWRTEGLLEPHRGAELRERLVELFGTRTAAQWEERGAAIGAPLCICRTGAEWLETDHARASHTIVEVQDPELGATLQPGTPVRLSATDGPAPAPRRPLDADRAEILAELERQPARQAPAGAGTNGRLRRALEGLRILDLTQVWAGPTAGRTLAEFGADVIKINDPAQAVLTHIDVNRGKRTLLLDLEQPSGLDVFWRLVEGADVVMQNFRFGTAERLGIGYEQVKARRPDVVYSSVSAYGYDGPWADRRGYEPVGQACSGLEERFGGDGPPAMQPFAVNDYGTGILGAFSMALGLFHRLRTGEGQHVAASLAYTGTLHGSPYLIGYDGQRWEEPRGQEALGAGPLQRLYACADGWLFLGAAEHDLPRLDAEPELSGCAALRGAALERFLEERLAGASVPTWVARLTAAGAGAHALVPVAQLLDDPWVNGHGLVLTRHHEGVGTATTNGPAARLSRTPAEAGRAAPPPGSDAAEILQEIGMAEALDALVQERAVSVAGVG